MLTHTIVGYSGETRDYGGLNILRGKKTKMSTKKKCNTFWKPKITWYVTTRYNYSLLIHTIVFLYFYFNAWNRSVTPRRQTIRYDYARSFSPGIKRNRQYSGVSHRGRTVIRAQSRFVCRHPAARRTVSTACLLIIVSLQGDILGRIIVLVR